MNLRETILAEHSKVQKDKIVKWVGDSQKRFDELFHLFLNDEYRVVQRAAYPLSYCVEKHPSLIKKHFGKLIKNLLKKNLHEAVKRNTVRILEKIEIPEQYHGTVMNICFDFVQSPDEAVAVKVFSLTVLDKLSRKYPDIKQELKTLIEDRWDYETAAFHSRSRKILKHI
jgi:hypothetical protein